VAVHAAAEAGHAPGHAQPSNRFVLKVFSGTPAVLVVGDGRTDGNPGLQLLDLSFTDNPQQPNTYLWAVIPGVQLLDRDCHPLTPADMAAFANAPGANSAIFIDYLGPDGRPIAPAKVQLWARSDGLPADCESHSTTATTQPDGWNNPHGP
jgi:hypothetical protein